MGRGSENVETKNNFLFAPPKKRKKDIHSLKGQALIDEAKRIADDMKKGDFLSLVLSLEKKRGSLADSPVLLKSLEVFSEDAINEIIKQRKLPKRAKGLKQEQKKIKENIAHLITTKMNDIVFSDDLSSSEKAEKLARASTIDYGVFFKAALMGNGATRELITSRLASEAFRGDYTKEELEFLLKDDDALESVIRREVFSLIHRASPRSTFPQHIRCGVFHGFQKEGTMHIVDERGKTVCSDNRDVMDQRHGVSHGDWHDASLLGYRKKCRDCIAKASKEMLEAVEAERGDQQEEYFGRSAQEAVEGLSKNEIMKELIRDAFHDGKNAEEIKRILQKALIYPVSDIMANAAEDSESAFRYGGGGHIAWSRLDVSLQRSLKESGYEVPLGATRLRSRTVVNKKRVEEFSDSLEKEDDVLLKATTKEQRRYYMEHLLIASIEEEITYGEKIERKGREVINNAVRYFLRQKQKKS